MNACSALFGRGGGGAEIGKAERVVVGVGVGVGVRVGKRGEGLESTNGRTGRAG